MGVNLGFILNTIGADAKCAHGPIKIRLPLCFSKRQSFSERSFINLDNMNADCFQIQDFIAYCQCQLEASIGSGLVIADK